MAAFSLKRCKAFLTHRLIACIVGSVFTVCVSQQQPIDSSLVNTLFDAASAGNSSSSTEADCRAGGQPWVKAQWVH